MSIPPQLDVTDPESGVSVGNDTWETNESTIFRSLVEARLGSAISRLRSTSNSMRFQQSPIRRPLQDGEDEVSPLHGSPPAKQAAWKHSSEVSPSRAAGARTDIPFRSTTAEEGGMTLAPSSPTAVSSSPVRKLRKQIESQVWSELIQSGPPYPSLKQSQAQIASYQQKIHYLTEVLHEAEVSLQDARGLGDRVATRRDQERTAAHQTIAAAEKEWRQYEATTTESMVDRGLDLAGSPLHALRARARVLLAQGDAVKQEWDDLQEKLETIPLEKREECEQALREREKLRTTYRTLVALTRRTADHQHITHQSTQHTAIPQSLKTDGSAPPPVYGACPMQCSMCETRIRIHQDPVNDGEQGPDIRRLREFTVHHPREGTADPVEGAALVSKDGTTRVADYPNSMTFDEGRILQEYQARIHNCERRGFQAVDVAHQLTHGNVLSVAASQASSRAVQCSSASETGNISNRKNGTGTRARTPSPSPGYAMDCSTSLSISARNSEFAHRSKWDATEFAWGVPAQANSLSVQVLEQSRKVSIHGSACHDVSSEVHDEREHLIEELAQKLDGIGQRHPSYWSGRSCARLRSWLLHHESYVTAMTCPSGSLLESTGDRHSGTHLQDARLGGLKQRGGTLRTHYMATCTTLLDNEQWFLPPHLYHRGTLRSMASVPTANNGGGNLLSRRMRGNASASIPRTSSRSPATRLHSTAYWAREFERRERLEQVRTLRRHAAKSEAKHASCT